MGESQTLTSSPNSAFLAGVSVSGLERHGVNVFLSRLGSNHRQWAELSEGSRGGKLGSQSRVGRLLQGRMSLSDSDFINSETCCLRSPSDLCFIWVPVKVEPHVRQSILVGLWFD